jgi:hypothetical protein
MNHPRFSSSPAANKIVANFFQYEKKKFNDFIIPTGVNHHPNDWTSGEFSTRSITSCLSHLSNDYLTDIQERRALLLFDQTLEGYQTPWLWEYLHKDCNDYGVNPCSIIFITGNLLAAAQYKSWADSNQLVHRINVFSYPIFESDVYCRSKEDKISNNFNFYFNYKKENQHSIKTFDCLQKRLRSHRLWLYQYLFEANLINNGLISMNPFYNNEYQRYGGWMQGRQLELERVKLSNEILPLLIDGQNNNKFDDGYYIKRICQSTYMNSWVSVVSEASFADDENTLFLSEKTFKPITCMQPFIIFGNRGSLKQLRERGYKTFDGFIDESYDDLPTFERLDAVIQSIKKVSEIKDKLDWYRSMKDILVHNYKTLKANSTKPDTSFKKIEEYYLQYFNLSNTPLTKVNR